jgi:hypothetical protein
MQHGLYVPALKKKKRREEITRLSSPLLPMSLNVIVNLSSLACTMKGDEFQDQPPSKSLCKLGLIFSAQNIVDMLGNVRVAQR